MNRYAAAGLLTLAAAVLWTAGKMQPQRADLPAVPVVTPAPVCPGPDCPKPDKRPKPWGAMAAVPVGIDPFDSRLAIQLPDSVRQWCRNNPTGGGSCVQASIQMWGLHLNVPEAYTLLFDSDYGKAELGGGWPDRTAKYAAARGMKIFNVTGSEVWDYIDWACTTGRGCAIGASSNHFQTAVGCIPRKMYWVCNNNSPQKIDEYDWPAFQRLVKASGEWCVVPDYPTAPRKPRYRQWW